MTSRPLSFVFFQHLTDVHFVKNRNDTRAAHNRQKNVLYLLRICTIFRLKLSLSEVHFLEHEHLWVSSKWFYRVKEALGTYKLKRSFPKQSLWFTGSLCGGTFFFLSVKVSQVNDTNFEWDAIPWFNHLSPSPHTKCFQSLTTGKLSCIVIFDVFRNTYIIINIKVLAGHPHWWNHNSSSSTTGLATPLSLSWQSFICHSLARSVG